MLQSKQRTNQDLRAEQGGKAQRRAGRRSDTPLRDAADAAVLLSAPRGIAAGQLRREAVESLSASAGNSAALALMSHAGSYTEFSPYRAAERGADTQPVDCAPGELLLTQEPTFSEALAADAAPMSI